MDEKESQENKLLMFVKFITALFAIIMVGYKVYRFLQNSGLLRDFKDRYKTLQAKFDVENITFQAITEKKLPIENKHDIITREQRDLSMTDSNLDNLSPRARNLLNYIKVNKNVTMSEIGLKFTGVTSRTIRRDLDKLESLGYVEQNGKTRGSTYTFLKG